MGRHGEVERIKGRESDVERVPSDDEVEGVPSEDEPDDDDDR